MPMEMPITSRINTLYQAIINDEESRPKLFAYFVQGGPGQILDNNHGYVFLELQTTVLA